MIYILYYIVFIIFLLYVTWLTFYLLSTGEIKYKLETIGVSALLYIMTMTIIYINLLYK